MTREQLKAQDKAVAEFEKHLTVSMVRKSNVIHCAYTASDPKTAMDTLNRLLAAFLTKQREIAQPPGTSKFFADQTAKYKQQLDEAQQRLAEFQQQQKVVSLSDTEQALDREINESEADLRGTDAQISELTHQLGSQTRHLKTVPARQMTEVRTIPNDYSIERLNTMLAELENKRTTLLTKFTPNDRLVQEAEHQITDTKTALAKAQQMTSQEHDTNVNPVWQEVTGAIIQGETQREALKAKHAVLAQQIGTLQSHLSDIEGSTVAFNTLRQKVMDLENNYQLYTQKRDAAQIADQMNANRLLNVAVAQSPTFSVTAYRPKPLLDIALGTFTAIFFASFMVFFAEMGRNTFASSIEVERVLQLPVLAEVPMVRGVKRRDQPSDLPPTIVGLASPRAASQDRGDVSPAFVRYRRESHVL